MPLIASFCAECIAEGVPLARRGKFMYCRRCDPGAKPIADRASRLAVGRVIGIVIPPEQQAAYERATDPRLPVRVLAPGEVLTEGRYSPPPGSSTIIRTIAIDHSRRGAH